MKSLEHLSCERRLGKLFRQQKSQDLIHTYIHIYLCIYKEGGCNEGRTRFFSVVPNGKTRQWAPAGTQEMSTPESISVQCSWWRTDVGCLDCQRGCVVSSLKIPKGHLVVGLCSCSRRLCWSWGWSWWTHRALLMSTYLWFCDTDVITG